MAGIPEQYGVVAGDGDVSLFCKTCVEPVTGADGWVINFDTTRGNIAIRDLINVATRHHNSHPHTHQED